MSDYEDNDDESDGYVYPSDDEDDDEEEEKENWERNVKAKESHISCWMDADDQDFRLWSEGSTIRMSIFSSLRQIVNSSSSSKRILCSKDDLFDENDIKTIRIFLHVTNEMVVVYTLKFDSSIAMARSPPVLKCTSYCGAGTYLFPSLLLPNCHSQFVDFGKVFDRLSQELLEYKSLFSSIIMVHEDSPYYLIQELAYLTQYRTSFVFDLDSGIVTGLERDRVVKPGDGVGYSVGYTAADSTLKKDDTHQFHLTTIMNKIGSAFNERLLDSPLMELLSCMVCELSVEEVTRSSQYAEAIFKLIANLQDEYKKRSTLGFDRAILSKLASFKDILSDEYCLNLVSIPEDIVAECGKKVVSPGKKSDGDIINGGDGFVDCDVEPVIYIEKLFTRHSYLSDPTATGKAILKRMKIEFNTLSTSLPPTIKYMVSEENISLGKFLIVGPEDTPYEGGYFLFDLKLPNDYPATSPKVNFLTTGGGSVRFNPNLYNCGKVCLSLLGTWSGEKWNPDVSNINQVLQSICYLIFVEEPYFNEPGYRKNEQSLAQSKEYTKDKRRSTVRCAVLDHLTHPDPYFGDIIRKMMIANWGKAKKVYENWASEDTSRGQEITANITTIERELGV